MEISQVKFPFLATQDTCYNPILFLDGDCRKCKYKDFAKCQKHQAKNLKKIKEGRSMEYKTEKSHTTAPIITTDVQSNLGDNDNRPKKRSSGRPPGSKNKK